MGQRTLYLLIVYNKWLKKLMLQFKTSNSSAERYQKGQMEKRYPYFLEPPGIFTPFCNSDGVLDLDVRGHHFGHEIFIFQIQNDGHVGEDGVNDVDGIFC